MRVWDQIPPSKLCRNHLLAEHRETLAIWSILTNNKKGYRNHPEVKRWIKHLGALLFRHNDLVKESKNRGYNFKCLPYYNAGRIGVEYITKPEAWDDQLATLKSKKCECKV